MLLVTNLSRLGLSAWQWERVEGALISSLLSGLRMDVMFLSQWLLIPVLCLLLLPQKVVTHGWFAALLTFWCGVFLFFVTFMETVTPPYVDFFELRPGRIFFEYLGHPEEVGSMILSRYAIPAIIALTLPFVLLWAYLRHWRYSKQDLVYGLSFRIGILLPICLLLALGARSTLGHRPVNPSTFAVSSDAFVNDLFLSSAYKVLYAAYSLRHEASDADFGLNLSPPDLVESFKLMGTTPPGDYIQTGSPHRWLNKTSPIKHQKNIVIVVEESLGARFVGQLGGQPLTPELDKWSQRGIWFEQLYATGIRSARGLEAIVSGFPPSAARSVLKLSESQHNFYTAANSLSELGYKSHFVYGGEGHFDNMKGFFLNNGFDTAVDIRDFDSFEFKGTWGVSDEDLFRKAHELMQAQTTPFITLIFTSSFHSPYEFPDGKIELFESPKNTKYNAVKYADYALGQFLDMAYSSNYWDNSVILVVADHDERPRGRSLVPISSYHIPGLILGGGIEPKTYTSVASQIDLMPTLFGLAGISCVAPLVGNDLLGLPATYPGHALMQYGDSHAYMEGADVVIHRPGTAPAQFTYHDDELTPAETEGSLVQKAAVWATLPSVLYQNNLYTPMVAPVLSKVFD